MVLGGLNVREGSSALSTGLTGIRISIVCSILAYRLVSRAQKERDQGKADENRYRYNRRNGVRAADCKGRLRSPVWRPAAFITVDSFGLNPTHQKPCRNTGRVGGTSVRAEILAE